MIDPGTISARVLAAGRSPLAAILEKSLSTDPSTAATPDASLFAVSGGGDSLPMLWLAAAIAQRSCLHRVVIAHVNHGLRPESVLEASMVEAHARAVGLECVVAEVDCGGAGNRAAIARRRREEALVEVARRTSCGRIVTAHHADDQLETVIAAIARGAGPRGWRGIHRTRDLGGGIHLVRPFLGVPRESLRELGRRLGLEPAEDPGNEDPRRLRGRLRRGVCRELESIFPGANRRVAAAADHAELAEQAIDRWLDEVWGDGARRSWCRERLRDLPPLLVAAGLRRALLFEAPELADRLTEASCRRVAEAVRDMDRSPRLWTWPGGVRVELTSSSLTVQPASSRGVRTSDPDRIRSPRASSPRR